MKKNNYNHWMLTAIAGCAMALGLSACTDELDIPQNGNISTKEEYYKTDDQALSGIAETYYQWMSGYGKFFVLLDALSDDFWAGGVNRNMDANLEQLNEYTFNSDNDYIVAGYEYLYKVVYYSNLIINNVEPDTEGKTRCVAEAHFLRGWANFYLAALWGTPPCLDHVLKNGEYSQGPSKPGELLKLAVEDFTYAKQKLPTKTDVNDKTTGQRITSSAATVWLGKALLWQGDKAAAAKEFLEVINSKLYKLWDGDLSLITRSTSNNCCENILEAQTPRDPNYIWSCEGWYNSNVFIHGYRGFNAYYLGAFDANHQMGGLDNAGMATNTWGYFNPRQELLDVFVADDGKGGWGYRTTSFLKTGVQMLMSGILQYADVVTQPGSDGIWCWKNRLRLEDDIYEFAYPMMACITQRHTRLAEVLLLAAECLVETDNATATKYVNEVRTRAQAPLKSSVTLDDIKKEKRMELCGEGIRYLDIQRWGDAPTLLANQGKEVHSYTATDYAGNGKVNKQAWTNSSAGFKDMHKLLPYPRIETEINKATIQNPGW